MSIFRPRLAALARGEAHDFCRRLKLEGWRHLDTAESRGRGTLLLCSPRWQWRVAVLALGLFRGPIEIVRCGGDPRFRKLAAAFEERLGRRLFGKEASDESGLCALRAGGRVAVLLDRPPSGAGSAAVPPPAVRAARESIESGAPAVPVRGYSLPGGAWRVMVRAPIDPAPDPESLAQRYLEAVEK